MAEERLKALAQSQVHVIPHRSGPRAIACGHAAQDVGFQNIVALQFLSALVQDDEHLMRLVDVVSDDDNDVAIVGDEIRKLPASFWTEVGKHRPVEIQNFEQCRFRLRRRHHIGRLQHAAGLQNIIFEDTAFAACKMQPVSLRSKEPCSLLRHQHAVHALRYRLTGFGFEIAQDCEQRHQCDEPLLAVYDVEFTRRHLRRELRRLYPRPIHQKNGAEKVGRIGQAIGPKSRSLDHVVKKLLGLLATPGVGTLINRNVQQVRSGKQFRYAE